VEALVGLAGYDEDTAANDADNVLSMELQMAMGQSNFSGSAKKHYDQWVDREYFELKAPSIDWEKWFVAMNFSQIGLDEDGLDLPTDEVCVCIYIYILYIYIPTHTHTHTHTHIQTYMRLYIYIYIIYEVYIHIYIYTHIHIYTYIYI
jgi:hypothetical protein